MLIGNGILVLGAIGDVIVPSIEWLLTVRLIQGVGAATSAVMVSAIIADVYKANKTAQLYGLMNAVFIIFMDVAPIIGGLINSAIGWRGNYGLAVLICTMAWLLLLLFLPEPKSTKEEIQFVKIIRSYKRLLSSPFSLSPTTVPGLLYGCYMAFVATAPFVYMKLFETTMVIYTVHQGIVIAFFAVTSAFASKMRNYLGMKNTIWTALYLVVLRGADLIILNTAPLLTASISLFCIGSASLYPIIFARSVEIFPNLKGTASSAIMSLRYFLCPSITWLASSLIRIGDYI